MQQTIPLIMLFFFLLCVLGILICIIFHDVSVVFLAIECALLISIILIAIGWRRNSLKTSTNKHSASILISQEGLSGNIFDDAPLGVIVINDLKVTAYNKASKKIAGDTLVVGKSVLAIAAKDKQDDFKTAIDNATTNVVEATALELPLSGKENGFIVVYFHKLQANEAASVILYVIDSTERRQLEQKVSQSQKMQAVGTLAGGIAHDFNNLLTAIMGYCDLLLARFLPSDQSFNDVMQIKQNSSRAANLIKQLLAFSRQQTLQPTTINVITQLSELSMLLKRLIGPKISLALNSEADFNGGIQIDKTQFEQVIINLVVNAKDAMPDGGTLTITARNAALSSTIDGSVEAIPAGKYVLIEVKDTGLGIPRGHISHMFEPFFSTKSKGAGTGLGLSTVYGIVKQADGFISVESQIKKSATFYLYFPYRQPLQESEVDARQTADSENVFDLTGLGKILLIEDEDAVRLFTARALRDKGYQVIEASDGAKGLDLLKGNPDVRLVVSDVIMPVIDGLEFLNQVRGVMKLSVDILFISGYVEETFRTRLKSESKVHFLQKPFGIQKLASKVKSVLDASSKPT
ncbi:MAG: response regulator [Holosporales bacterium]|jgi:two-component system cell cycle sensor histidine kinase/response regulator CckA|nr:response regulator [Holosporales bacterium]